MSVLILGKIPPPTGGVTVHVSRLISRLESMGIEFTFFSMSKGALAVFKVSLQYRVIHLHTSNPYFRFIFAVFCFILRIRLIQTYHGDLGRFGPLKNAFDMGSVMLTAAPVVINRGSFEKAVKRNRNTSLISSFIAPSAPDVLPDHINEQLGSWETAYNTIFCTNASCLKYDKHREEVYGGSALLNIFTELTGQGLIFSDPSGEYLDYFSKNRMAIPENVLVIRGEHNFMEVMKRADCFIRASTTDGDSVSVKEALYLKTAVIASDCVGRPDGCIIYRSEDFLDLKEKIAGFRKGGHILPGKYDEVERILALYKQED